MITCAHEDDNLLFMCPDEFNLIAAGGAVLVVYLTTGDAGLGASYWEGREQGAQAAAAYMAGELDAWYTSTITVNGYNLTMKTLKRHPQVTLVFMRLPDGNGNGSGFADTNHESLMKLWTGAIASIQSADGVNYTSSQLAATLAALISFYQPATVFTQNFQGTFTDGDHVDHVATAFFTKQAAETFSPRTFPVYGYEGYPVRKFPANVSGLPLDQKENAYEAYAPYDWGSCRPVSTCFEGWNSFAYGMWLPRQYVAAQLPVGS